MRVESQIKMNARTRNAVVIDGRTFDTEGNDISEYVTVSYRTPEATKKGYENKHKNAKHQKEYGGFVFSFFHRMYGMLDQLPEKDGYKVTQSDLARIMFVGTYVGWGSGQLKHDNGVPITKKSLRELVGLSTSQFSRFNKRLTKTGVLIETQSGIFMNSELFARGFEVWINEHKGDKSYTRVFRKTVRQLYHEYNGRTIKQLALVYAVLPFVNFNYNIVAHNPEEPFPENVKPMTVEEIAEELGYSDDTKLVKAMRRIKFEGQSVFGFFEIDGDKRKRKVVVNPAVVYAGGGETLDAIKALFS